MSSIREQYEILVHDRREYQKEMLRVNREINELRRKCPHDNVDKSPSFVLDQVIDDERKRPYREILERRISCKDCGHGWSEQRYAHSDDPWPYDEGERG